MDNKSGEIRTKTYLSVFVHGLRIPSRFSPCKTFSREIAQTSGFYRTTKVKTYFDCKMFDVTNWVAHLNGENGPGGTPSHEALSVSPQGALEISSVIGQPPSLDRNHFSTPRVVAESHKCNERCRSSSQRPHHTDASNEGWGTHLEQASTKGLWSDRENRLHINVLEKSSCLIIVIAPGWPGMPWFWDLVHLSTEIPLQLPVSTTLLKQSHNYVFHSNPQHHNLHAWCLRVDSSKNKASLWRWQKELLPLKGHQQGPSTSQSGPYLRNGAEKIRWISPLPL